MPSLHFGYSLLIGLTVALVPLSAERSRRQVFSVPLFGSRLRVRLPSLSRVGCLAIGFAYPALIFVAIVVTVAVARRGLRGGRHVGLALRGHAHTLSDRKQIQLSLALGHRIGCVDGILTFVRTPPPQGVRPSTLASTPRPRIWEWAAIRLSPRSSLVSETVMTGCYEMAGRD